MHTGSSSEYGLKDHAPAEDELVVPDSVYAITKCAATHAVSHWARKTGCPRRRFGCTPCTGRGRSRRA